jgi:hypothetical protein
MKRTVFYSWQSDIKAAANRSLIQGALEAAAESIAADGSIRVETVIDRDTANVPGSPDIGITILEKVRDADVVVADVTIINEGKKGRATPNPNVLIEVGYALATHSESKLILVQNSVFGGPELLPFDLRQKRVLQYESKLDDFNRASARRQLQGALQKAIASVLEHASTTPARVFPVELALSYKTKKHSEDLHIYQLRVSLKNIGTRRINQWHVTIDMPRKLLASEQSQRELPGRSNNERVVFRYDENTHGPLYPEDTKLMSQDYRVDQDLYLENPDVLLDVVKVRAYVEDELGASIERPVQALQHF